jgi:hypothetical protein
LQKLLSLPLLDKVRPNWDKNSEFGFVKISNGCFRHSTNTEKENRNLENNKNSEKEEVFELKNVNLDAKAGQKIMIAGLKDFFKCFYLKNYFNFNF